MVFDETTFPYKEIEKYTLKDYNFLGNDEQSPPLTHILMRPTHKATGPVHQHSSPPIHPTNPRHSPLVQPHSPLQDQSPVQKTQPTSHVVGQNTPMLGCGLAGSAAAQQGGTQQQVCPASQPQHNPSTPLAQL